MTRLRITPKTTPERKRRHVPGQGASMFWRNVSELAAMREHIPPERRAGSSVRALMARESTQAEIDRRVARFATGAPARDALGNAYPAKVPNRIEAEPLDPQTPAYWRAVWGLES